jgi:hypothetical protein
VSDRTQYHVVPKNDAWQLQVDGKPITNFGTKDEAVADGRERARAHQPSQLIVHTADGRIENEATYSHDPYPPSG